MTQEPIGIVWNPSKARREEIEAGLAQVDSSSEFLWFETSEDDPGRHATSEAIAEGARHVIAAGGDGTVRAVIEGLKIHGTQADLGIIPLGTGNLLARNLDLPLNDIPAALQHALNGTPRAIDIGQIAFNTATGSQKHVFAVIAGFGLDAHMISETDDDLKDKVGWAAYVESLGRAVNSSDLVNADLTFDSDPPVSENIHTFMVGNCGTIQGGVQVLPDADPTDGQLDALSLSAEGMAGWLDTFRNMIWDNGVRRLISKDDRARDSNNIVYRRFETLQLHLRQPRSFEVDGDVIGFATDATIKVMKAAIRVRHH